MIGILIIYMEIVLYCVIQELLQNILKLCFQSSML